MAQVLLENVTKIFDGNVVAVEDACLDCDGLSKLRVVSTYDGISEYGEGTRTLSLRIDSVKQAFVSI